MRSLPFGFESEFTVYQAKYGAISEIAGMVSRPSPITIGIKFASSGTLPPEPDHRTAGRSANYFSNAGDSNYNYLQISDCILGRV
jgi:hypothetical protein